MNLKSICGAAIATGGAGAAWAIQKVYNLPTECAPIRSTYDKCYETALQKLGGGLDIFDMKSWGSGISNSWKASSACIIERTKAEDCESDLPYYLTALACTTVALYAALKLARR